MNSTADADHDIAFWARRYCGLQAIHMRLGQAAKSLHVRRCTAGVGLSSRSCETHSLGSGFCAVSMDLPQKSRTYPLGTLTWANCIGESVWVMMQKDTHAYYWKKTDPLLPPAFVCPASLPIAVLLVPKAGSLTVMNWLVDVEGLRPTYEALARGFADLLDTAQQRNPHEDEIALHVAKQFSADTHYVNETQHVSIVQSLHLAQAGCSSRKVFTIAYDALRWQLEMGSGMLALPPYLCQRCCLHPAHERLLVVQARNPFMRLASFFKRRAIDTLLATEKEKQLEAWGQFGRWVLAIQNVSRETEAFKYGDGNPMISPSDVLHLRSVKDMLDDKQLKPRSTRCFFALHVETLEKDLQTLADKLCREYGHCHSLPKPGNTKQVHASKAAAWVRLQPLLWEKMWAPAEVRAAALELYGWDFKHLGYSVDPFGSLLPISVS